ncbi:hypothetical protein PRIEUP_LOCUS27 [Pristimantis euphronides]
MNIVTAALISVSALWAILEVNALQCYSCTNMSNNTECNQQPPVTCNSTSTYCFTQVEKLMTQNMKITKRCAESSECNSHDYNVGVASKHTSCCSADLCNKIGSGKNGVTSNAFLILAAFLALCIFKNI